MRDTTKTKAVYISAFRTLWLFLAMAFVIACFGVLAVSAAPIASEVNTGGGVPEKPSFLSATPAGSDSATFSWVSIYNASGYNIYRQDTAGGVFNRVGNEPTVSGGAVTSFADTGLLPNTQYAYRIASVNDAGESAAALPISITTERGATTTTTTTTTASATSTDAELPVTTGTTATSTDSELPTTEGTTTTIPAETETTSGTTGVSTPTDVQTLLQSLLAQVAVLQSKLTAMQGGTTSASSTTITANLSLGSKGSEVTSLQTLLKAQGADIYPEGLVTGYFGGLTEKAVQKFQEKYGIAASGDAGYGYVGPKTRTKLNALIGQ